MLHVCHAMVEQGLAEATRIQAHLRRQERIVQMHTEEAERELLSGPLAKALEPLPKPFSSG